MQFADYFVGKTIESIQGAEAGSEDVTFFFTDGTAVSTYHSQDCCESVSIDRVAGDMQELIGKIITSASEEESHEGDREYGESCTWTEQTFEADGVKAMLVWLGQSNGYYSETPYTRITHGAKV
jgi:hypothetical protein